MVSSANVIVTHRPNPYADWAQDRGLRLGWCRAWRNECSPLTAHKTLNQGDNILESRSARRLGFDSAVYLNTRGDICETTNANLFFVRDGRLYTPDERCGLLPGTVRAWLCERYEAEQGTFRQDSLDSWDESSPPTPDGRAPGRRAGGCGLWNRAVTRAIQREYRRLSSVSSDRPQSAPPPVLDSGGERLRRSDVRNLSIFSRMLALILFFREILALVHKRHYS